MVGIILLFTLFGTLFYLYQNFYPANNTVDSSIQNKPIIVSNSKIYKLEEELEYSDTIANRIELADEHTSVGNHKKALELYKTCLDSIYHDDVDLLQKVILSCYFNENYDDAITFGKRIGRNKIFEKSDAKIAIAWSYYNLEEFDLAKKTFNEMDKANSNFQHRFEFAKFLNQTNKLDECKSKLDELLEEFDSMGTYEKRLNKALIGEIKDYYKSI